MSVFTNNLKKLMEQNDITYAALSRQLGISKNGFKYWETAGNLPNPRILLKIANHFGVSVDWLTGIDTTESNQIADDEHELLEVFRQLNKSGKRQLIGKAYELLDAQPQQRSGEEITTPDISVVTAVHNKSHPVQT